MEEKERYKWSQDVIIECAYEDYDYIVDTENNIIFDDDNYFKLVDLLNQQDKENQQLKQQLHDLPKKIVVEIKDDLLDFSNGWWRYFMTDGCEYMLSSDLQGCLDEIIDTILKKYGDKNESNND